MFGRWVGFVTADWVFIRLPGRIDVRGDLEKLERSVDTGLVIIFILN